MTPQPPASARTPLPLTAMITVLASFWMPGVLLSIIQALKDYQYGTQVS